MNTISNERLESLQRQFKEEGFNDIRDSEVMQLVEENLALRKERERADPVYQMLTGGGWFDISKEHYEGADKTRGVVFRVVYTAPPAPVVPDALTWEEAPCESIEYVYGWNDCRAAMLKGTEDATS